MKIVFLGDSLTEGWPGQSFFSRLSSLLPDDNLLNYGRAGDTIAAMLARLKAQRPERADLAVLWIGTNDAFLGGWDLPPLDSSPLTNEASFGAWRPSSPERAYEQALDLALACAPAVVCVPPLLPDPFEPGGITARIAELAAMEAAAVGRRGPQARLFDLAEAFAAAHSVTGHAVFTIDGVHLSAHGADVVAHAFAALIASWPATQTTG